jgi:hypothetical protein
MHFKSTGGSRKVLLIRAPSAITALLVARGEVFEVVILVIAHRIVPRGNSKFVLIIFAFEVLGGKIFTRQACRRDRFLVLNAYIILWNLSANIHFTSTVYGVAPVSPHLTFASRQVLPPCVDPCH